MVSVVRRRHGNAQPHGAASTRELLVAVPVENYRTSATQFRHCTSDHYLFLHFKEFLACQSPRSDQETKDVAQNCLKGLATNKTGPTI
jgi:hypothetical protein